MKKERQKKEECGAPYRPWLYRQVDRVKGTLFFFFFCSPLLRNASEKESH